MKAHIFLLLSLWSFSVFAQELKTVVQRGHLGDVTKIISYKKGKYVFTAGQDYSVKLWDTHLKKEVKTYFGHDYAVLAMAISPNDSILATGGKDDKVICWNIFTGESLFTFEKHRKRITSLAFSLDGKLIASGGYDNEVLIWEIETQKIIHRLKVDSDQGLGYGISLQWHPKDKNILLIGNDNYTVDVWDIQKEEKKQSIRSQENGTCGGCASKLVLSKNDDFLIAANKSSLGLVKDTSLAFSLPTIFEEYKEMQLVNNELFLVTEKGAFVYQVEKGSFKKRFEYLSDSLETGVFDGNQIIIGGKGGIMPIFSKKTGKQIGELSGFLNAKNEAKLSYDISSRWDYYIYHYVQALNPILVINLDESSYLVKGKMGSKIRLLNLKNGLSSDLQGHEKEVLCLANYEEKLLSGSGDKTIKLWDLHTKKLIKTFEGHRGLIFNITFNQDGTEFLSASWDATVKRWDVETGKCLATYNFDKFSPFSISYTPNDLYFLTGTLGKKMELWEMDTKEKVKDWVGHSHITQSLVWNKSKSKIISASWDYSLRLWDWKTGLQVQKFKGHTQKVHKAIFSADEKKIITASADRTIRIWDIQTGKEENVLKGHQLPIVDIAIFQHYLFSCSIEGIIKIWDLNTKEELASYVSVGQNDWLLFTKKGYFDTSQNAKNYIFFTEGVHVYSLEQFFEQFYQPKLFEQLFSYGKIIDLQDHNLIEELRNAPPPTITILSPELGENIEESGIQQFLVRIEDNGGGIDELKVLHNGKRIEIESQGFHRKAHKGNVINKYVGINLIEGVNHVEMTAFSKGRIESAREEREFNFENSGNKVNCYVISVGINAYENTGFNLNYAKQDAKLFSKMMKNAKRLYNQVNFYELYDKEATKENLLNTLKRIQKEAKAEDVLYFYYAGHGTIYDHHFYLVPTDLTRLYEEKELKKKGLSTTELQNSLQKIVALKQVVILDACHSGEATKELGHRGALEEKAIAQLSRSAGVHILASAGSEQFATEFKQLGHGVFTYALMQAFNGQADGAPNDGKITVYELKAYLDSQVPELTHQYHGGSQFPHTFSTGSDFPIILIKK